MERKKKLQREVESVRKKEERKENGEKKCGRVVGECVSGDEASGEKLKRFSFGSRVEVQQLNLQGRKNQRNDMCQKLRNGCLGNIQKEKLPKNLEIRQVSLV